MNSAIAEAAIPPDVLRTWQHIVDLLANIMHVPSAVVTQLNAPDGASYRIVSSSHSPGNPFPVDDQFAMDIGTFCETVIKTRGPLLVANALADPEWRSAPETRVGMISYLGFPVCWPDGRMFGTICVLDDRANHYSDVYQEVLRQCRDVLQADLETLARLGGELEEQRAHLSELFARVPDAIVMIDRDSHIQRVNPAFTKIFGFAAAEAIGRRLQDLITPDDQQHEVGSLLHRMVTTQDVVEVETVRLHKDGTRVPVARIGVPVSSSTSDTAGYVIYRDISESRRLQEEQRRYHELQLELAHANRIATVAQLSASIAHELNQPLTGIISNCGAGVRMLAGEPPDIGGAQEAIRRTLRDGNRAAEVIARLRALFTSMEPASSEPVDISDATREVIALSAGDLQDGKVVVRSELAGDLPRVIADRVQLQQVVLNLLRNALDAMRTVEDRPRDLLIRTERDGEAWVRVSVSDVGVGFDVAAVDRLFEAFYTTKQDGMGVGLSVSRSIIERHRGRMWATLNEGPGATFGFAVPCQTA